MGIEQHRQSAGDAARDSLFNGGALEPVKKTGAQEADKVGAV